MQAGLREILIISTPKDIKNFQHLLGDGSEVGIKLEYAVQKSPDGIAQSFIIGEEFVGSDSVCLILGDNLFYGKDLTSDLKRASSLDEGGHVFGYSVDNPENFGVIEFDSDNKVISIEEKPKKPKSKIAVTGLYFYDNQVLDITRDLKPSKRGELEITDINSRYLENNQLEVTILSENVEWLDTGTHDSLLEASSFIKTVQEKDSELVGSIELIAYRNKWLKNSEIIKILEKYRNTPYGTKLEAAISID
tara:strand:- start:873 stop:1619 length:747 start_codon:yes stop_codon:yes gene_type:complete